MKQWLLVLLLPFLFVSCEFEEVEVETGYKGKARLNAWLAAEQFAERMFDVDVQSFGRWAEPKHDDTVWVLPASSLSNDGLTRKIERWVLDGGHLILVMEYGNAHGSDWMGGRDRAVISTSLDRMLAGVDVKVGMDTGSGSRGKPTEVDFQGTKYLIQSHSGCSVRHHGGDPTAFASVEAGYGRYTLITDGRIFRNRWIQEHDHAALLAALIRESNHGNIGFVRGTAMSFWAMLREQLWPMLIGLAVLVVVWLWKNFSRFGPMDNHAEKSELRGYEYHLEALGDFQWRLDRAAGLLEPIRALIVERTQRLMARSARSDEDFFQFLSECSGIPRSRVQRALTEQCPADATTLTRTSADLQRLLQILH